MSGKQSSGKSKKKFWIIAGIIVSIIAAVVFTANTIAEKLVLAQIHKQFNNKPGNLYNIESAKLNLNILNGNAKVTELKIAPNDSAYLLLESNRIKSLTELSVEKFTIHSLDLLKFIREGKIHLGQIKTSRVSVSVIFNSKYKREEKLDQSAFSSIFTSSFQMAEVSGLLFENITLRFFNDKQREKPFFELDSLELAIDNIYIDPQTLHNVIPFNFDNLNLITGGVFFKSSEYYNITTTDISFNLADTSLAISGFALIPRYSKEVYNQKKKYNSDWYSITVPEIRLNHFHLNELDSLQLLHFTSIKVQDPIIEIFRDKTLPDPPYKYKPLPASLLKKIPLSILVDTLKIKGKELIYEEKASNKSAPGRLFFNPFYFTMYHITNHPNAIARKQMMEIDYSGIFMGKSKMEANLLMNLASPVDKFTINGNMDPIKASELNPITENLLSFSIDDGQLHGVSFHFNANDNHSNGKLNLFYDNFKMHLIAENDDEGNAKMKSFVANNLIRNRNMKSDRKYLVGNISFDRLKDKSLPNFIWKSLKSGIVPIVAPLAANSDKEKVKKQKKKK